MEETIRQIDCMSIVVPVFNRPGLIVRCLDSLKSQTYRPLHVIVVDNASTDETLAEVTAWKAENMADDFTVEILSEPRKGAAYARETGLEHVKTEKVMFFDSDDTMRPRCVEDVMEAWNADPDADAIAWRVAIHAGGKIKVTHSIKEPLLERHLVHAIFRTQGYAIKTDFLIKAGGWRGEFPNWNDLETGLRVLLLNPKVKALSDVYVDVYHQKESITGDRFSDKAGKWEKSLAGIDESIAESGRSDQLRLHNIVGYRYAVLAADYYKEGCHELAGSLCNHALAMVSKKKRPYIRFSYWWTKMRMPGAFMIVGDFL